MFALLLLGRSAAFDDDDEVVMDASSGVFSLNIIILFKDVPLIKLTHYNKRVNYLCKEYLDDQKKDILQVINEIRCRYFYDVMQSSS